MTKKINLILLIFLLVSKIAICEAPYMINYQGVARTSTGIAIANKNISIRASILHSNIGGTIVYSEIRNLTTDDVGLFSFKLNGPGATSVTGIFSSINWSNGNKLLQIEIDTNGGSNFINMGTQQLVSVPYAQHSNKADGLTPYGQMSIGAVAGDVIQFDGTNWKAATPTNTFSLPYLISDPNLVSFGITNTSAFGGSAITGKTTANHANATGVKGEATGTSGRGVYGLASNSSSFGVLGQNTSGTAIKGMSTGTNSIGVYGESTNGTGLKGYSNDSGSVAIFGSSLSGTGVKAYSYSGNALEVIGNVKISGGNIAPSEDAILTSDALGNAHWEPNTKVAFRGHAISQALTSGTANNEFNFSFKKVEFLNEEYDLHGDFTPTGANASNSNSSTFVAPVNGIYHFDAAVTLEDNTFFDYLSYSIRLVRKRGSTTSTIAESKIDGSSVGATTTQISADRSLLAGDQIWIEFKQINYSVLSSVLRVEERFNYFTGHLVYQQ